MFSHPLRLDSHRMARILALLLLAAHPTRAQLDAHGNELLTALDLSTLSLEEGDGMGSALAIGDFDGNGHEDLAIGLPYREVGTHAEAGIVVVLYDVATDEPIEELWSQNSPGVGEASDAGDRFGSALAVGDFNGDDIDDLAIGAHGESLGAAFQTGVVHMILGSPGGLDGGTEETLTQSLAGGVRQAYAHFGAALTSGDFDADGYDDLALGAPGAEVAGRAEAGSALVVYGTASGPDLDSAVRYSQWTLGAVSEEGDAEAGNRFGTALVAADLDGDGIDDLAVGAPFDAAYEWAPESGVVNLVRGSLGGLMNQGNRFIGLRSDYAYEGDWAGSALAAGDFDGDGLDDLALGAPGKDSGDDLNTGMVFVLHSQADFGPRIDDFAARKQNIAGGAIEAGDELGAVLAAGDFDCDGFADLAVGVPNEGVSGQAFAGEVSVFMGDPIYIVTTGTTWHQNRSSMEGVAELGDQFGSALAVGRLLGGCASLAIGIAGEGVADAAFAGAVQLLHSRYALFADGFESGDLSAWGS